MTSENRRVFLADLSRSVVATAGTATLVGAHGWAQEKPTKLRLGIIGCGAIMTAHVKGLIQRNESVSFGWLCDIDPKQIEKMEKIVSGFQSTLPKRTSKFEEVISDEAVDACIIATPHHWHTPIALLAMQAGKDVYIEKPISHVYNEGRLIIEAAKKYKRVVQQGSQMRSSPVAEQAGKLLRDGVIGDIKVARAWTAETRTVMKPVPDSQPPEGVDYDRWLGPAPSRPFNSHRFHKTWRMFRDYGNGEIGDDGIHDIDMAVWGLGVATLPKQITARGGVMLLDGHSSEYPDNLHVSYEYPDGRLLIYENYPFTPYGLFGFDNGNVFYGTEGYMVFSRRGAFSVFLGPKQTPGPTETKEIRTQRGYAEHMAEFLRAVRDRTPTRANPDIAHRSCALVHFGDIAQQTRGQLSFDAQKEQFVDCPEANRLLSKIYREDYPLPSI